MDMKKFLISLAAMVAAFGASAQNDLTFIECSKKAKTSFAIFTDNITYEKCQQELHDYRNVLEAEGLATYIIAADWTSPDQIKKIIGDIAYAKPRLEGMVFVGDVPIVMVREGQHMTTAFKMNEEKYGIFESSVASDRFYDDFDLKFEFLKKDEERSDLYYYRLSEKGAQTLRPEVYSARMKVPFVMEGDKYEIMKKYLKKVVAAHKEVNYLDNMSFFAGHGYNSDCLTAWRQKPMVFRENFPYCFEKSSTNRFLNFRQHPQMQKYLFNEIQREGVDFFQFSEHGAPDTQYINGSAQAESLTECYESLKKTLGRMFMKYKGTADEEPFLHEVDSLFQIPREAFSDSALASYNASRKAEREVINITLDELMKLRSNARITIFNACYNGSFHNHEGYVAGCHVFSDGDCIIGQGNTVNVLQDKWEDKLMGILSLGVRAGMWQKEVPYLEGHMIGDPTYRFTPKTAEDAKIAEQLHHDLVFNRDNEKVWKKYLKSDNSILRAVAITYLGYIGKAETSDIALDVFKNDPSWVVRTHALFTLKGYCDENTIEAIKLGLNDPYEIIVRHCCHFAGDVADKALAEHLEKLIETRPDLHRASYSADCALDVINGSKMYNRYVNLAANKEASVLKRVDAIRTFRNNKVLPAIPVMLDMVKDSAEDEYLRTVAAEVLGWYTLSCEKAQIVNSLSEILQAGVQSEKVRVEIEKTIKRLN